MADDGFVLLKHSKHKGEALFPAESVKDWQALGWERVVEKAHKPAAKRTARKQSRTPAQPVPAETPAADVEPSSNEVEE